MNLRRTDNRKYPTLYASALLTLTKQGYTKHYFEGSRRICSKIGGGFSNVPQSDIDRRVAPVEPDYDEMHNSQRDGLVRTFAECLGAHPEPDAARDLREVVDGCLALNDPEPAFFYHSDHLGSTAYLTNDAGQVTQTLNYLPYGEDWADVQNFAETRYPALGAYAFSGKEKDYESALLYFGARHHDSELLTAWLSVDPLADKYPSLSPYAYCAWNPVKLVDEDGEEIWISGNDGNLYQYKRGKIFDSNGKKYSGSDEFVNKVYSDLKWLRRNGIRRELREMERNRHKITIYETDKGSQQISLDEKDQSNGVGCSSNILFNPTIYKLEYDGETLPMYGLAHELGHAYDAMLGIIDDTFEPVYENGSNFTDKYIKKSEIRAVRFENYVRPADFQRTSYRGLDLRSFGVTKPKPQTNTTPDSKDAINLYDLKIKQFE